MARAPIRSYRSRTRARSRNLSPVEWAIGLSLAGSVLAVAVPTFARDLHGSRVVEAVDGLHHIGSAAVEYAKQRPIAEAFPPSVGLTPPAVPRGQCLANEPGLWDAPTWRALDFAPTPVDAPHCFAFSFESTSSPLQSSFVARAHGDLDGDGTASTFEIKGHDVDGDPAGPSVEPGMYIDSEIE